MPESSVSIYLAETQEQLDSNWVVNKNEDLTFCALGASHALEQISRSMKVSRGLVGITLNPNARTRFFIITPELARLAEEAKEIAGTSTAKDTHHHTLTVSLLSREEKNIGKFHKSLHPGEQQAL